MGGCHLVRELGAGLEAAVPRRQAPYGEVQRCVISTAQWCSGNTFAETRECLAPASPIYSYSVSGKCGGGHSDLRKRAVRIWAELLFFSPSSVFLPFCLPFF